MEAGEEEKTMMLLCEQRYVAIGFRGRVFQNKKNGRRDGSK